MKVRFCAGPRVFFFLLVLCPLVLAASQSKKKEDPWVSMEERVKIWDKVVAKELGLPLPLRDPKPYTVSTDGLEATFEKGGDRWTIIGANSPIVNPTVYPKDWPVKGNDFEVLVIPEPITNYKILPFTEKIENAVRSDTISIAGAADSYEPASFVIRSGDIDLRDVMVEVTDLQAEIKGKDGRMKKAVIPKKNIDIRVVKCWYQAGGQLNDTNHKTLKPELLLHDDGLVKVDYETQVELLRNYEKIRDAEKLKPFAVPGRENKQVWLTAHVTQQLLPGKYSGFIRVVVDGQREKKIGLEVEVLPLTLPEPMLDYALYYEGYLVDDKEIHVEARRKSEKQMLFDLEDMKAHGLTNATLWHEVNSDVTKWDDDWQRLRRTLELRKKVGWGTRPLLYLDWHDTFKENLPMYRKKVQKIISIARSYGISDVYIYGMDERRGTELAALRPLYGMVHAAGARNFVAITEGDFLLYASDVVDIPVFWGIPGIHIKKVASINKKGIRVWKYSQPQAGLEEPETYRENYGIGLLANGFSGACDYQYQRGSWNDFADPNGRMNTMAYPTVSSPVSTIEWEGWREGVNDVRYLTALKNRNMLSSEWLKKKCSPDSSECRNNAIKALMAHDSR
jgi:hypothetical protein